LVSSKYLLPVLRIRCTSRGMLLVRFYRDNIITVYTGIHLIGRHSGELRRGGA
jgi:hypothetical protein